MKKIKIMATVLCLLLCFVFTGCTQQPDDPEYEKWNLTLEKTSAEEIITAGGGNVYVKTALDLIYGKEFSSYFTAATAVENDFSPENLTHIHLQLIADYTKAELNLDVFMKNSEKSTRQQELESIFEEKRGYVNEVSLGRISGETINDVDQAGYYRLLRFEDDEACCYFSASGEKTVTISFIQDFIEACKETMSAEPTLQPATGPVPEDYPPVDIIADGIAEKSADLLSEILVSCLNTSSSPERPVFNDIQLLCGLGHIYDTDFCYYNIFPVVDGYKTQFKAANAHRVLQHLFGEKAEEIENVFPEKRDYNPHTLSYEFSTDFGWGVSFYYAENVASRLSADGSRVVSSFRLYAPDSSSGDPGHRPMGRYSIIYDVVTEAGETFLRFSHFEKN